MTGTNQTLAWALTLARHGYQVFPCQPGQKTPATRHGHLDATTDERQITRWFSRHPDRNLAIATGAPGPDVLDVDQHGPAGNGFAALRQLRQAGLLNGAAASVRTPGGGLHYYFAGSQQRNGHLPGQHLDFRSTGGYVLVPPSTVNGRPYRLIRTLDGRGGLDWAKVTRLLEPERSPQPDRWRQALAGDAGRLAAWVAGLEEGNRNAGLFWAANRVLDADQAADLDPLAAAARHAGLGEREIRTTLQSARRTAAHHAFRSDPQAEEVS
jgi:hypothetical protein